MPLISFSQVNYDTVNAEQARLDSIRFKMEMDSIMSALDFRIDSLNRAIDSIFQVAIQKQLAYAKEMQEATKVLPHFKIYPTDNNYISLKLDTKRGKVWMVQYGMHETIPGEIPIQDSYLVSEEEGWNGRFELYPTKNVYNFILVDNYDGETFQVQWGTSSLYRFIQSITNY